MSPAVASQQPFRPMVRAVTAPLQTAQDARTAPARPRGAAPLAARPPPLAASPSPAQASQDEVIAIAKRAAERCAGVVAVFAMVAPDRLWLATRGSPKEAFARQLWMAGLVRGLGFSSAVVGQAIGRHKDTVDHACAIIGSLHGDIEAGELIAVLGEPGVREFLGGADLIVTTDAQGRLEIVRGGEAVEECLEHAERLIDDLFAAFELVAVRGEAFCREIARRNGSVK